MNIGIVGLGKLGLPIAVTLGQKYQVRGYDINPNLMRKRKYEHKELGPTLQDDFQKYFEQADLEFTSLKQLVEKSDIIFVAVQTPHQPLHEGITRLPKIKENFDYQYLIKAVKDINKFIKPNQIVVIISTVLPGTIRKLILPKIKAKLVYNPFFIAMSTVMKDFTMPEFVLLGSDTVSDLEIIKNFYHNFYGRDLSCCMSIESAELTKLAYNTFISQKIVFINTMMEICHKTPNCNIDDLTKTLSRATDRIISPKYLTGGMGDSGACHPRDAIAMSWLAQKLNLSYDIFNELSAAREKQAEWLIDLMTKYSLPKVILGKAYKPEVNITTGSISLLCANLLEERNISYQIYDPFIDKEFLDLTKPSVFLVATKHQCFKNYKFAKGSIIIDPHRYIPKQDKITIIPIGIGILGECAALDASPTAEQNQNRPNK